ncbi:MAG: cytochrome c [Bryobacterales bacterium]
MNRKPQKAGRAAPILRRLASAAAAVMAVAVVAVACIQPPLQAHEIITTRLTWTEQISRIFQDRCVSCHHEGGGAPMPLTTYEQVRPWAKAIKYEILSRRMPPWDAVKGYGEFGNDLSLSQDDIAKISSWVEGGAPEGSDVFLPPAHDERPSVDAAKPATTPRNVSGTLTLERDTVAVGIEPANIPEGGSLQAAAFRPDGSVEPLIWLRDYRTEWQRVYWFREPLQLPKGTRILLFPSGQISATLLVK